MPLSSMKKHPTILAPKMSPAAATYCTVGTRSVRLHGTPVREHVLFGCPNVNSDLRDLLWKHHHAGGGFEAALAELEDLNPRGRQLERYPVSDNQKVIGTYYQRYPSLYPCLAYKRQIVRFCSPS